MEKESQGEQTNNKTSASAKFRREKHFDYGKR